MPTTLNQYILGRTLGSGVSCKVKLAKDAAGTRYAIKIIHSDESFQELIDTEVSALAQLQHRNIVRLVEVNQGEQHNPKKGKKQVKFIVLELVGGGELFDFVALGGRLSEATARYYFKQLLDGLSFMHAQGYAHRDLKPENLLLDRDYVLKITDLGFAAPIAGRDNSGLLQTQLGTASYMAPEIHLGKEYEGARVDLFASAIILFVILTQRPPFTSANPQDPHYRLIAAGRAELFWQAHAEAESGEDIYTPEFKDLFQKMMTLNPAQRPQIDEINAHPWMQGTVPSEAEVKADFANRKNLVDQEAHNEREAKRAQRHTATADRNERKTKRAEGHDQEDGDTVDDRRTAWESLEIEEYGPYFVQDYTQFFMSGEPLDYFDILVEHLEKNQISPRISGSTLRCNFVERIGGTATPDEGEESKQDEGKDVKVDIQILRLENSKCCVKFAYRDPETKVDVTINDNPAIYSHFKGLRDHEGLKMFNDTTYDEAQLQQQQ